jgi:hypothetical protein
MKKEDTGASLALVKLGREAWYLGELIDDLGSPLAAVPARDDIMHAVHNLHAAYIDYSFEVDKAEGIDITVVEV